MSADPAPPVAPLTVVTTEIPDPGDLLGIVPQPACSSWVHGGQGLVGWGQAARVPLGTGPERFARAQAALAELARDAAVDDPLRLPGTGLVGFVSITFDPACDGSVLVVPEVVVGRRDGVAFCTRFVGGELPTLRSQAVTEPARIRYAGASVPELSWLAAVDAAIRAIRAGQVAKVVLARDLHVWSEQVLDSRALLRRLARRFPDCYTFAVDGLVGATPELLLRRQGPAVDSLVLAGSAARDPDPGRDAQLGRQLRASAKDQEEHRYAVASVQAALEPVCATLQVEPSPHLLRLDNVQHLATTVAGRLAQPLGLLALAARLHPTAAVCGTPTPAALALIRRLEGLDRGRYAGPVGWVGADGNGELGIALRCAEVTGMRARLFAGGGLVRDSLPEAELAETRVKLLAMQSALETEPAPG